MSDPIIVVDTSEVREGKLEEVRTAIKELAKFVESHEDRPIAYCVYLNERGTRMTVIQVHPDSASMEFHMKVAGPAFSKFVGLVKLATMDIYGSPSAQLLQQVRAKVEMLGDATVTVHALHAGFARV